MGLENSKRLGCSLSTKSQLALLGVPGHVRCEDQAINDALEGLVEKSGDHVVNILDQTWDPEEADRFVKLAQQYPALLRFEEDRMWKAIRENPKLWTERTGPRIAAIREQWPSLRKQYLMEGK